MHYKIGSRAAKKQNHCLGSLVKSFDGTEVLSINLILLSHIILIWPMIIVMVDVDISNIYTLISVQKCLYNVHHLQRISDFFSTFI